MAASAIFVALTLAAPASRRAAWAAGFFCALSLALGLESLPVLAAAIAALALRYIMAPQTVRWLAAFGVSLALSTLAIYAATVPPARWLVAECDALAFNTLGLTVVGGLGLALVDRLAAPRLWLRGALLAGAAGWAVTFFLASDPACVAGPYGHFDPALWTVWIDYVSEMLPLSKFAAVEPAGAAFHFAFTALGVAATAILLWRNRAPETITTAAIFLLCALIAALHVRGAIYANWYAVPIVAALCASLHRQLRVVPFACLLALFNPATIALVAVAVVPGDETGDAAARDRGRCFDSSAYRALAALPPGLVLAELDLAPYVLALTPHRILVGPYHRLSSQLVDARRLEAGAAADAEAPLRAAGVDYVVDCHALVDRFADRPGSFRAALMADKAPAFLTRVETPDSPLMIWKLKR
jgi:hypothetical protein